MEKALLIRIFSGAFDLLAFNGDSWQMQRKLNAIVCARDGIGYQRIAPNILKFTAELLLLLFYRQNICILYTYYFYRQTLTSSLVSGSMQLWM